MHSTLSIRQEAPDTPNALALLGALDDYLSARYAPENRHGLTVAALLDPSVTFLVARLGDVPVGCAGVKIFPDAADNYAEVKRMYVAPEARRQGVAQALLETLEQVVRQYGFRLLRLETGIYQQEAVALYECAGFVRCAPFGPYADDGVSLCYEKVLDSTETDRAVS